MYKRSNIKFQRPIDAIIPTYDPLGNNVCQVIYSDGTSKLSRLNVSKFLSLWFQFLGIDLYAQRRWVREILKRRNINPITINENASFIPVKFRKAVGDKDGCYGYVRVSSIQGVTSDNIYLASNVTIPHLFTTNSIYNKINDAKLLSYIYIEERKVHDMIYRQDHNYSSLTTTVDPPQD